MNTKQKQKAPFDAIQSLCFYCGADIVDVQNNEVIAKSNSMNDCFRLWWRLQQCFLRAGMYIKLTDLEDSTLRNIPGQYAKVAFKFTPLF